MGFSVGQCILVITPYSSRVLLSVSVIVCMEALFETNLYFIEAIMATSDQKITGC